jgi:hypothetical protein
MQDVVKLPSPRTRSFLKKQPLLLPLALLLLLLLLLRQLPWSLPPPFLLPLCPFLS